MKYGEFIAQVQQRARLGSRDEADVATSATLTTLGERLAGGEAKDLASQLPVEIGHYLTNFPRKWNKWSGISFFEEAQRTLLSVLCVSVFSTLRFIRPVL